MSALQLGNHAAESAGMHSAPMSVEDGVAGVLARIDEATRAQTSGRFMTHSGDLLPW